MRVASPSLCPPLSAPPRAQFHSAHTNAPPSLFYSLFRTSFYVAHINALIADTFTLLDGQLPMDIPGDTHDPAFSHLGTSSVAHLSGAGYRVLLYPNSVLRNSFVTATKVDTTGACFRPKRGCSFSFVLSLRTHSS